MNLKLTLADNWRQQSRRLHSRAAGSLDSVSYNFSPQIKSREAGVSGRQMSRSDCAAVAFIVAICAIFSLHLLTGIADNGDFSRTFGFLIKGPVGWAIEPPAPDSPDWHRRFFQTWIDAWTYYPAFSNFAHIYSASSIKVWMLVQAAASVLLTGNLSTYSIIAGSIPGRIVYLGSFIWLFILIRRHSGRAAAWAYLVAATPIILASAFVAFLNSFFEEQIMIIGLPLLAAFVYASRSTGRTRYACWALAVAVFIGLAKTAYFLLPVFVAPFVCRMNGKMIAAAVVGSVIAFLPAKLGENRGINEYHALYLGALTLLQEERGIDIQTVDGKPIMPECVGHFAYTEIGKVCREKARATYFDTIRVLVKHPLLGPHMFLRALRDGNGIGLSTAGMRLENAPSFADAPLFRLWQSIYAMHVNVVALICGAIALALSRRLKPLEMTGLFFAVWGGAQYGLALGDGFMDLQRHVIGANFCLSLAVLLFFAALAGTVGARRSPGLRSDPAERSHEEGHRECAENT